MKILFMGTPDFAVPCLDRLVKDGHDIVGVYTQPDKPKGRGHKLAPPPIKEYAVLHNIPVFQPTALKTAKAAEDMLALAPDLCVVVAYGRMLPPTLLSIPKNGCVNVHGSLLPKYRGAGPIQWSVINGEKETGITTMYMAEGMDTGDMLLSKKTPIGENETAGELYDRLAAMGADVLSETVRGLLDGSIIPQKQNDCMATYAPMLTKELSKLDFNKKAREIHHLICGLSPWPAAETYLNGKRLKIFKSHIFEEITDALPGTIIDNKLFVVSAGDKKAVVFDEVQYEGSRKMSGDEFLRGHRIDKETKLEF